MTDQTSRPEGAFVLMLMQSTFWVIAGISALPFVLAGEVFEAALGAASFALAAIGCVLAIGLVRRRSRARRWAMALETTCFVFSTLLLAVPLGANRGPVSLMVNLALPAAVVVLLRGKKMRAAFSREAVDRPVSGPGSASGVPGLRRRSRPDAS